MNKNVSVKLVSLILSLIFIISAFAGCKNGGETDATVPESEQISAPVSEEDESSASPETTESPYSSALFSLVGPGDNVEIHSKMQKLLLGDSYDNATKYAKGVGELSRPSAVKFSWTFDGEICGAVKGYTVKISENEDLSDAWEYTTEKTSLSIYNVKIGTKYYWNVTADTEKATVVSDTATFTTAAEWPRNLLIDGVTNARDLGGRATSNGGYTRQGLIYRTARLNANSSTTLEIKEAGIDTMLNQLGIKTEIDLRRKDEAGVISSPLGESVKYYNCPIDNAKDIIGSKAGIAEVFHIMADKNNYPLFFHCSIGTDRTNLIAFILNGICGVSESDLYYDYVFSNLGFINATRPASQIQASDHYVTAFKKLEGETLADKLRTYLRSIGVTDAEMDSIIEIFRQDPS